MAKSGPQRYPGASTAYWHQSRYGGDAMESNVIVWHTTEGTSVPSYGGGASAPNFTARPDFTAKRLVWYQHFDFDVSSRALVNKAGGVDTNTLNVCQVEIVGTCDPAIHKKWGSTPHLYTPDLPDWAVRDLAAFARWAHEHHGVPLTSGVAFEAYPASYGTSSVRMSGAKWSSYRGHCGHQHVPENDHGDPGLLPMAAILARAKGDTTPEEDDMPSAEEIAKEVWAHRIANPARPDAKGKPTQTPAEAFQRSEDSHYDATTRRLTALAKQVAGLTATVNELAHLAGSDIDTAQVVAAVEKAIADAVVKVDVDITGTPNQES